MSGTRGVTYAVALAAGLVLACGAGSASAASSVQMVFNPSISQLVIIGEADDDVIGVSVSGGTITITDTGTGGITTPAGPCTAIPTTTVTCPLTPPGGGPLVTFVVILGAASDRFVNQNLEVAQNQFLGDAGDDVIESGPGNDVVVGGDNDDTVRAGAGDDTLVSGPGTDVMDGGPGQDLATYSNEFAEVKVSLDGVRNDGTTGADNVLAVERVQGSLFNDVLLGDGAANELSGGDGDDTLVGGRGRDELFGQAGDDQLTGGGSRDRSSDHLDCGSGLDLALAGPSDLVEPGCERSGARVVSDTAKLDADGGVRVRVACPAEEGATCRGKLILLINGKRRSTGGRFKVKSGKTGNGSLELGGAGRRSLEQAGGSLIVEVRARTTEPGGKSSSEARVLLTG